MAAQERELDVVLWGATGFTGRLVAEQLLARHGAAGELRWALGGRNRTKLEALRADLGPQAANLELVLGDGDDEAFLDTLTARAQVVCSTVGPYALYGSKLVAACARNATHYCDLTGEVHWMQRMIDAHQKQAEASGARIVPGCGFDSIPSDLGVLFVQREMQARHGVTCPRIKCRATTFSGGASGGTIASMLNLLDEASSDPRVRHILADPYSLNPAGERSGPDGADLASVVWDPDFEAWIAPFVMAAVNCRVVRRSSALLNHPWGREFRDDEATLAGPGPAGWLKAAGVAAGTGAGLVMGAIGPLRRGLSRFLPAPGEGPSLERREAGRFELRFFGEHPSDARKSLFARVIGDRDPGYGSTAKMLSEAAVCLAQDEPAVAGGFWTPAAAMGEPLLERLQHHAGVTFSIDENAA
jgi:short subunit dehydrogenase-like uncharacterized protein